MTVMTPSAVRSGRHVMTPRLVLSSTQVRRLWPHLGVIMQYTPPTLGLALWRRLSSDLTVEKCTLEKGPKKAFVRFL